MSSFEEFWAISCTGGGDWRDLERESVKVLGVKVDDIVGCFYETVEDAKKVARHMVASNPLFVPIAVSSSLGQVEYPFGIEPTYQEWLDDLVHKGEARRIETKTCTMTIVSPAPQKS